MGCSTYFEKTDARQESQQKKGDITWSRKGVSKGGEIFFYPYITEMVPCRDGV